MASKLPMRANRGLGANNRQAAIEAQEITKKQLKNKFCLVLFEDHACSVVSALSNSVCLELGERADVEVSLMDTAKFFQLNNF